MVFSPRVVNCNAGLLKGFLSIRNDYKICAKLLEFRGQTCLIHPVVRFHVDVGTVHTGEFFQALNDLIRYLVDFN